MSSGGVKRQMQTAIVPQTETNQDIASLSTIGMRIRKAVSDGYNNPNSDVNQYSYQSQFTAGSYIQRVPLPSHMMDQPPSLTNMGSTLDSSASNLAEWDSKYQINNAPIQTIDQGINYNKRKLDDHDTGDDQRNDVNLYTSKYGELKFNEEF
ncbi:hypothetical protein DFJ63DRAFT_310983 [Scheffersomyces coipomensis]|uniref:uncharacterized protein n=1 Tax=Scheffersomyces coipomensis TaxID=1788519 RepID=UPI00315D9977